MKRILQCVFTSLALFSVLSCASTGTSTESKQAYAKLAAALRDNQTIEIYVLRDTWEARTNGEGYSSAFRAFYGNQIENVTNLISTTFKNQYPG
jgi:hypothetical protein